MDDIQKSVQQLPNDKYPGIDGFYIEFFKEYWPVIGIEVINNSLQFFESDKLLKSINYTTVTIIRKLLKSISLSPQFRLS